MSLSKIFSSKNQLIGRKISSVLKQHSNGLKLQESKSVNINNLLTLT